MFTDMISHLQRTDEPLVVSRRGVIDWSDEDTHRAAFSTDPAGYALLALVPGVPAWQRARILAQILGASWAGLDEATRSTLDRVVRVLVVGLPATHVTTVLLALRHRRANHKHLTRATVRLLVEHPGLEPLLVSHRRVLIACLEHALGKATARGAARTLLEGRAQGADLHRSLYRFAADTRLAAARVGALYAPQAGEVAAGAVVHLVDLDLAGERPGTVTATNRGDIAATLVHIYRGGVSPDLTAALTRYVETVAARLPRYPGTLALVLDCSASMRGYGDREWAVLSQSVALRMVLERACARLVTIPVGGDGATGGIQPAAGATDLAGGVLDALAHRPDLVAVVTDGYENVYPGDLARITASLPRAGVATPVVVCTAAFGHSDDLARRRPAPDLPQLAFWHEEDFAPLMLWLLAHTSTAAGHDGLMEALRDRLCAVERQLAGSSAGLVLEGSPR